MLSDATQDAETRKVALASLVAAKDKDLAPTLQSLVTDQAVGREAIRGLAAYADPKTPETLIPAYPSLDADAKRDAINTLASRPAYANELLRRSLAEQLPRTDLSADVIRQMRNLKDASLEKRLNEVWGVVRETAADKQKLIADFQKVLARKAPEPDIHLGRAMYAKTCAQCHKLFDTGGEVGPELTGSNRRNLEYVLSNVLDPSAVMAKDYQPSVIVMTDGRVITGIVKEQTKDALTIATANETVIVPRGRDRGDGAERNVDDAR